MSAERFILRAAVAGMTSICQMELTPKELCIDKVKKKKTINGVS